jgi:hypothetical protein
MGRPEKPLAGTNDPIAAFAHDLRELRKRAGNPSYRQLARRALFVPSVLSSAASGHRLPTLPVTLAFVASCGGDRAIWERRWRKVAGHVGATTEFRPERAPAVSPMLVASPAVSPAVSPPLAASPAVSPPLVALPAEALASAEQSRLIPRAVSTPTRPAQLPIGSSTFVGRRQALASAARVMGLTGRVKIPLMISGPIGAGKTAFALRLADDASAEFPDGQLYADLGTCGPGSLASDGIMRGFLRALGVPMRLVPDDQMQRIGLYRSLLAQRRLFVLLENAYDEGQVRPFLGQAPHSQFVGTSSARLLGLDGVHRIELDTFTRQESMTLIGRLAGPERVQAEYEAADAVAELCEDLPLAVNIIGRKIAARPEWTVAYTARLLADRDRLMDSLSVGDVNVRDRFALAYRLLSSACRRAIQQLGLNGVRWATAIGLAAAMGISTHSADELLESLVDVGLLTRANAAGRYFVSTLVGVFAGGMQRDATRLAVPLPTAAVHDRVINGVPSGAPRSTSTTSPPAR